MKTVIQVWGNKFRNVESDYTKNYWGIGDAIRGTIKLFQLSKKMNFKLVVDTSRHPISNFLKLKSNEYNINENLDFVFPGKVEEYINNNSENPLCFFTTDPCDENIDNECKEFIKGILIPNDELQEYINKKTSPDPFNIIHYRLGDEELIRKNNGGNLTRYLDQIKKVKEPNDILISDSVSFKNLVKLNIDIKMFDTNPAHLGHAGHKDSFKDTIFEFFLVTKSKKIKTYSVYDWVSGFVYWAHKIYDIPIEILNNEINNIRIM
jgi:hypothetical protein